MRITRFVDPDGQTHHGVDRGDGTADLLAGSPLTTPPEPTGRSAPIQRRLAPVEPANIFCVGLNYREHAREMGKDLPERPVIFMKPTSALAHPGEVVMIPACSTHGDELDHECELAVVIGKRARDVDEAAALDHVLGYTGANDVSARRWQKNGGGGQWIRGKSFDTFCPLGPILVTADELDPADLAISTTVNGEVRQQSRTSDMIFSVAQLIAFLSQDTTLLPGTLILTGTPPGVGVGRTPAVFLKAGDEVTVEIEHIGPLTNPIGDMRNPNQSPE